MLSSRTFRYSSVSGLVVRIPRAWSGHETVGREFPEPRLTAAAVKLRFDMDSPRAAVDYQMDRLKSAVLPSEDTLAAPHAPDSRRGARCSRCVEYRRILAG